MKFVQYIFMNAEFKVNVKQDFGHSKTLIINILKLKSYVNQS